MSLTGPSRHLVGVLCRPEMGALMSSIPQVHRVPSVLVMRVV